MGTRLAEHGPLYARLAEQILADIARGRYPVGSLLPTEQKLCALFGVSRVTVRGALRELALRGLISRQAGVGTRVASTMPKERFVHESSSIEDVLQFTDDLVFHRLGAPAIASGAALDPALDAGPGERFIRLHGLRVGARGIRICLSTHYVPVAYAAAVAALDGQIGSLASEIARRFGLEIVELAQTIEAVNLDKAEADALVTVEGDAALATWRRYFAESGTLVVASRSLFPKDRYSYSIRNRREPAATLLRRFPRLRGGSQ